MELTDEENRRLASALGTTVSSDEYAKKQAALRELAFEEYVEWILGRHRFDSVSALDRKRILEVFASIRLQAPTVEALANEFEISESRAVAMLARMRYGNARIIRKLQYDAARDEIREQRGAAQSPDGSGLVLVWVTRDTGRLVDEANSSIMRDQVAHRPGGKYAGAEIARVTEQARAAQQWSATNKMWDLIDGWLQEQAEALSR